MPDTHHVVVDGSNLATEGRTLPSLAQLDEAVRAYAEEDPAAEIVVVVDASFEHRIDASERAQLEEAELHGEIVSPPAGAIGRGDAFVLRIAERTGALVLSNDSFQEFHGEHPWLFDEGRLIGGKPVPGVGWIFTPRTPVRGVKSRQATGKAKRGKDPSPPAPVKAAELAKAAKKMAALRAATKADGSTPEVGDVLVPVGDSAKRRAAKEAGSGAKAKAKATDESPRAKPAKPDDKRTKSEKATKPGDKATKPTKKATTATKPAKAANKAKATKKPAEAAKPMKKVAASATPAEKTARATKATKATKKAAGKAAPAKGATKAAKRATKAGKAPVTTKRTARRRPDPELLEAIDEATAEALSPPVADEPKGGKHKGGEGRSGGKSKSSKRRRRTSTPPPAVNEPLAFITFVAAYPLGSEVTGEVASFTSHGAMIEVGLPEGGVLHCYIPLAGLGRPAPTKAREVLTRGERREFELVSLDPPRRVAELALPGLGAESENGSTR